MADSDSYKNTPLTSTKNIKLTPNTSSTNNANNCAQQLAWVAYFSQTSSCKMPTQDTNR